jgi:hypothetical protein
MVYVDAGEAASDALAARERTKHLLAARGSASAAGVKVEEVACPSF